MLTTKITNNAGYWAELAGGGQVTASVFDRHVAKLEEELEEGRIITPRDARGF